jgi:hypothetical protein
LRQARSGSVVHLVHMHVMSRDVKPGGGPIADIS